MKTQGVCCRFVPLALSAFLTVAVVLIGMPVATMAGTAYLSANHHSGQFDAWDIQADGTIVLSGRYPLHYSTDPAGVAIDLDWDSDAGEWHATMFITSEFSGGVEIVDPENLEYLGISTGPSDLAGIDVDDEDNIVYTVRRSTNDLYIFQWDSASLTMTQLARIDLPGMSGAFGLAFDDTRDILWVADSHGGYVRAYDTDVANWNDIVEMPELTFAPDTCPIDVAIDRVQNRVYTISMYGGAYLPGCAGSNYISMWDVETRVETLGNMGHPGVGIAVDETSGYVYVTGGAYSGDNLSVWDPSVTPFVELQDTGRIGNPAGIAIAAAASYDPMNLEKNWILQGEAYIGGTFSFELHYNNLDNEECDAEDVVIVDTLPANLDFVSATDGGVYDPGAHIVTWNIGTVPAGAPDAYVELMVRVNSNAEPGGTIENFATIGYCVCGIDCGQTTEPGIPQGSPCPDPTNPDCDLTIAVCPPDPEPLSQGYWHRQCLGVSEREGGIDPGRNGRGPEDPTEPLFVEELMPYTDNRLEDLGFYAMSTCEGMDADPPSDMCEKATKQFTALILNTGSFRLGDGCLVDLSDLGCQAISVGELIDELAELILTGYCNQANSCAAAINEGEGLAVVGEPAGASTETMRTPGTSRRVGPLRETLDRESRSR